MFQLFQLLGGVIAKTWHTSSTWCIVKHILIIKSKLFLLSNQNCSYYLVKLSNIKSYLFLFSNSDFLLPINLFLHSYESDKIKLYFFWLDISQICTYNHWLTVLSVELLIEEKVGGKEVARNVHFFNNENIIIWWLSYI
jgi:hypothetical protein